MTDSQTLAAIPDPLIGTMIGERYRILERLGEGGMGVVYRAEHVLMKKPLALKFLHPELARHAGMIARFRREAQLAGTLESDHIAAVTDFGFAPDGVSPSVASESATATSAQLG